MGATNGQPGSIHCSRPAQGEPIMLSVVDTYLLPSVCPAALASYPPNDILELPPTLPNDPLLMSVWLITTPSLSAFTHQPGCNWKW